MMISSADTTFSPNISLSDDADVIFAADYAYVPKMPPLRWWFDDEDYFDDVPPPSLMMPMFWCEHYDIIFIATFSTCRWCRCIDETLLFRGRQPDDVPMQTFSLRLRRSWWWWWAMLKMPMMKHWCHFDADARWLMIDGHVDAGDCKHFFTPMWYASFLSTPAAGRNIWRHFDDFQIVIDFLATLRAEAFEFLDFSKYAVAMKIIFDYLDWWWLFAVNISLIDFHFRCKYFLISISDGAFISDDWLFFISLSFFSRLRGRCDAFSSIDSMMSRLRDYHFSRISAASFEWGKTFRHYFSLMKIIDEIIFKDVGRCCRQNIRLFSSFFFSRLM